VTKGLLGLVLVLPILLVISTQDAYAVPPDCTTATLFSNEMYIVSNTGQLHKIDINTNPAATCLLGDMKVGGVGANIQCTDIALDPTTNPDAMYCVTMGQSSALYTINRLTGDAAFVGDLCRNGDCLNKRVKDVNGADFDFGGLFYAVSQNGNLWRVDKTNGDLGFLGNLGHTSSGDLAYDPVTAQMYWSTRTCPIAQDPDCAGNKDGLFKINLVAITATFVKALDLQFVFALDFTSVGELCGLTGVKTGNVSLDQAQFLSTTPASASGVMVKATSPVLIANGGTALNLLLGGMEIAVDKLTLIWNFFNIFERI